MKPSGTWQKLIRQAFRSHEWYMLTMYEPWKAKDFFRGLVCDLSTRAGRKRGRALVMAARAHRDAYQGYGACCPCSDCKGIERANSRNGWRLSGKAPPPGAK